MSMSHNSYGAVTTLWCQTNLQITLFTSHQQVTKSWEWDQSTWLWVIKHLYPFHHIHTHARKRVVFSKVVLTLQRSQKPRNNDSRGWHCRTSNFWHFKRESLVTRCTQCEQTYTHIQTRRLPPNTQILLFFSRVQDQFKGQKVISLINAIWILKYLLYQH